MNMNAYPSRAPGGRSSDAPVCAIIAAKDAQATIARAIRSALAEPEVGEVVMVDDGSHDDTAAIAKEAGRGDGRLTIVRLESNFGPAAARNAALERSAAPFIAVLDADDVFLPGRFAALLAKPGDWDAVADNVVFVSEREAGTMSLPGAFAWSSRDVTLSLEKFVLGNIARHGKPRGELGFLKPLITRRFLEDHSLRYDESLRLGEDFELYVRMLLCGARFKLSGVCGYLAAERAGSLSASHRAKDLEALMRADDVLLARTLLPDHRAALQRHRAHVAARWHHRVLLASRHDVGIVGALSEAARHPRYLIDGLSGVLRDKAAKFLSQGPRDGCDTPRFLVSPGSESESALLDRLGHTAGRT